MQSELAAAGLNVLHLAAARHLSLSSQEPLLFWHLADVAAAGGHDASSFSLQLATADGERAFWRKATS